MATKNIAEVVIAGRILKITGYESAEYLHQIASYINDKIALFQDMEGYRKQSADQKQIMIYMNLADDYFKSRRLAEQQKAELEKKDKEMYSLKHDLIESQLARENLEKSSKEKIEQLEAASKEEIKRLKSASKEEQDRMQAASEKELEQLKASSKEEIEQLQKQIRELRQQIYRLESEGKGKNNKNTGNHSNYNFHD